MTIGLYAGSFDPPHLGHLSMITTAARWCDRLYVVAAGNPSKRTGLFTLDERRALLAASTRHLSGVVALAHGGLVVDLARDLRADVLVRGMGKEQHGELEMAVANERAGGPPTVFLPPSSATSSISSSRVRATFARSGAAGVVDLVPGPVALALAELAGRPASVAR